MIPLKGARAGADRHDVSVAGRRARIGGRAGLLAALLACLALAVPAGAQAVIAAVEVVPQTFSNPLHIAQPARSNNRLFVVEQPGTIRQIKNGALLPQPFLDITARVRSEGGEEGLLSIAFPPNYGSGAGPTTRRFYVYFTNNSGDLRIKEYKRTKASGDLASTSYSRTVLAIPHPGQANHNGGQLQFGPEGFLYAATGDGGAGNDPPNNAQNKSVLLGKLLRINPLPKGGKRYTNPPGNPFAGPTAGRGEIFSLGLRNPWRFSFDGEDLAIGDVGQEEWEEIDLLDRHDAKGANFGWSGYEGFEVQIPARAAMIEEHTEPVFVYVNNHVTTCAVVGGYVVRDPALPIAGEYLYSDNCGGDLRSFALDEPDETDGSIGVDISGPSSFGVDNEDRLYVASRGDDHVYRLTNTP